MKIMVAMSGGLDSSMAAALLQQQGHQLVGITMRAWKHHGKKANYSGFDDEINDARNVAQKLNIPHYVVDVQEDFYEIVVENFKNEYFLGRTPNPCVICNRQIKFGKLIEIMQELGCEKIATGHYAKIKNENGRFFLQKSSDSGKDQTYFMWNIQQESLSKILFPLSEYSKAEIRQKANDLGLLRVAAKRESYNLCFLPNTDYRDFLTENESIKEGNFILLEGTILGKHKGFQNYTIGQRKGLEISYNEPLYVIEFKKETNEIVLGKKELLFSSKIFLENCNFQKYEKIDAELDVLVKIRHTNSLIKGKLINQNSFYQIELEENIFAIATGQSAVFYENDDLVGGGFIV